MYQLLATDNSTVLTDQQDLLKRQTADFQTLLNDIMEVDEEVANRLSQSPIKMELDESPRIGEVEDAIGMLCEGKSPRPD